MEQAEPSQPDSLTETEKDVKAPNIIERVKEEIEAVIHSEISHGKETHGGSQSIEENTPVDEVKAPNIFERAKEEVEALVEAIHPSKDSDHNTSSKEEGFWGFLARHLEKFCAPWDKKTR